jgi:LysM repeat protein
MTAGPSDRRVKIRRTGRHTSPSQVEKVALTAGKAAPAVAIAGALVVPTAQTALADTAAPATATAPAHQTAAALTQLKKAPSSLESFATKTVTVVSAKPAKHAAKATSTHYQVREGDTLSSIAEHFYHRADAWQYLFHVNDKTLSDPDTITAGEDLFIPATAPAHYTLPDYKPKHSAPASGTTMRTLTSSTTASTASTTTSHSSKHVRDIKKVGGTTDGGTVVVQTTSAGTYSCAGLEQLWDKAGGNPADSVMAAEIAMAESGGNPNAISPTNDYGLWQINASNGSLATLDPQANARSAVIMSHDGTDWDPWTTYTAGLYYGKC